MNNLGISDFQIFAFLMEHSEAHGIAYFIVFCNLSSLDIFSEFKVDVMKNQTLKLSYMLIFIYTH